MGSCCSCQKDEDSINDTNREDGPLLANDTSINNHSRDASTSPKLHPQVSSPQDKVAEIVNKTASSLVDIIATQQQQQQSVDVSRDKEEAYEQAVEGIRCPLPPQPSLLADVSNIEQELNAPPLDPTVIQEANQTSNRVTQAIQDISVTPAEDVLVQHLNVT